MWIFDECEILEDDDFHLEQEGNTFSLVIREVYPEDGGEYTCRLIGDNDVEVECTAQLTVKGKQMSEEIMIIIGIYKALLIYPGTCSKADFYYQIWIQH